MHKSTSMWKADTSEMEPTEETVALSTFLSGHTEPVNWTAQSVCIHIQSMDNLYSDVLG